MCDYYIQMYYYSNFYLITYRKIKKIITDLQYDNQH